MAKKPSKRLVNGLTPVPINGAGPQPIPTGRGREYLLREEPYYDVRLDAGTFDWLWRLVEARALQHQNKAATSSLLPEVVTVSRKAVIAFREAAGSITPATDTDTATPLVPTRSKRRKLVRVPESG